MTAPMNPSMRIARTLLVVIGLASLSVGAGYTAGVATAIDPGALLFRPPWNLTDYVRESMCHVRLLHGAIGTILIAAALLAPRVAILGRTLARPVVSRTLLVVVVLLPLWLAETTLGALVPIRGPIFEPDTELGWRLRPGARGVWGRTLVEVNAQGSRGPEVGYERSPGVPRILFLGDSVTFGFFLEERDAFPAVARASLEKSLDRTVEIVNAGVGGYSQWQQRIQFERSGARYAPDVAVITFVLNDVTERHRLARFGGPKPDEHGSAQLALTRPPKWIERFAVQRFATQRRFMRSRSERIAAERQRSPESMSDLRWFHTIDLPHDPHVERAWRETLEHLDQLIDSCEQRGVPVLLVVVPFTVQAGAGPELRHPQRILSGFAAERSLPFLDLLPVLETTARERGVPFETFFVDDDHLSPPGARIAGESIGRSLMEHAFFRSSGMPTPRGGGAP